MEKLEEKVGKYKKQNKDFATFQNIQEDKLKEETETHMMSKFKNQMESIMQKMNSEINYIKNLHMKAKADTRHL